MGQEARIEARWGRKRSLGQALLESTELRFRGEFRLVVPFQDITNVAARDGELSVTFSGGTLRLFLGAEAAKWAEKIRKPKSVLEKLGVKAGLAVAAVGIADESFLRELGNLVGAVRSRPARGTDLLFLGVATVGDLSRLPALRDAIAPAGAIWAVWPKGRAEPKEDHIRQAAIRAGLVDVKVVAFSPTHSALKLVIPKAKR